MRILHVIPAAFNYFDDIRSQAFKLLEGLRNIGVDTEAFTLQYEQSVDSVTEAATKAVAPKHAMQGVVNAGSIADDLSASDLVHMHVPFLGAARTLLAWKKYNPQIPLVVTVYRQVSWSDLFSVIIWVYNLYYLRKLLQAADTIVFADTTLQSYYAKNVTNKHKMFIEGGQGGKQALTQTADTLQLSQSEALAWWYAGLYSAMLETR